MEVDFATLKGEFNALLADPMVIAGATPRGGLDRAAAEAMCKKLGIDPDVCMKRNSSDSTYYVVPDKSQIETIIKQFESRGNGYKMSIAVFQTWKAGFDSQISRIEESMQARGQKYSNEYSRFENYHKMISSVIQSMADMLKSFLQF